jgi:hypothetical protein
MSWVDAVTPEQIELAKTSPQIPGYRRAPGMLIHRPDRLGRPQHPIRLQTQKLSAWIDTDNEAIGIGFKGWPDLLDPGTAGCLLEMIAPHVDVDRTDGLWSTCRGAPYVEGHDLGVVLAECAVLMGRWS